jgi:hypothetical protein
MINNGTFYFLLYIVTSKLSNADFLLQRVCLAVAAWHCFSPTDKSYISAFLGTVLTLGFAVGLDWSVTEWPIISRN